MRGARVATAMVITKYLCETGAKIPGTSEHLVLAMAKSVALVTSATTYRLRKEAA